MNTRNVTCALMALALMAGCGDSTGPDDGDPPVLPAVESLQFDIGFFDSPPALSGAPSQQVGSGLNWATAALSVGIANLAVIVHLAVPVATWRAATTRAPVFEDGQWHWRFSVTEGNQTYGADLAGFADGDDAVFEMRVTSTALGLDDFLWYTGRAPYQGSEAGTTGRWEFYDPQDPGTVSGRIDWSHPGEEIWGLTFTAVTGTNQGDTLTYDVDGDDRTVSYFDASANETVEVYWNRATGEGHITAPNFNNGDMACWDSDQMNVACP